MMAPNDNTASAEELQRLVPCQLHEFAVILIGTTGRIVGWLSGAERIFGYTAEEVCGKPVDMLFCPEDVQAHVPDFERNMAEQDGRAEDDRWMLRKDGFRFWAAGTLNPLKNSDGQLRGFAKVLRNRSDFKGHIETLERRVASLERGEASKDAFIATLAHELRGPLSSLVNAAEIVRATGPSAEPVVFALATIDRQVAAMRRLVDDLVDIARVSTGKVEIKKEPLSLHDILRDAVDTCRPLIDRRTHELKVLLTEQPATVLADGDRLRQVFVNLLENAAKYTEYGGSIFLKLFDEGDEAVVKVEDTGIGISSEDLPRIFDLFTQAELVGGRGGLGIGLSVVKDLVTLHGGSVQVRSDGIGKGSEFMVRLPLAQNDARPA